MEEVREFLHSTDRFYVIGDNNYSQEKEGLAMQGDNGILLIALGGVMLIAAFFPPDLFKKMRKRPKTQERDISVKMGKEKLS